LKKTGIVAFGDKHGGGVYQYTQSLIDALREDSATKYIIFCNSDDTRFDEYGLEVRKLDKPYSKFIEKIIRAFQFLFLIRRPLFFTDNEKAAFSDIELFISPAISAYPHFYLNKPFVFTLHDMQERYYPEFFTKYERILRWLNNRTLAKSATKIICESSFVKNDIVKFTGVDADKINIIQAPPPKEFLNYKFDDSQFEIIRQRYGLPKKYIFYPANCWRHKNHIKLVDAFKIVQKEFVDVYLIFSGSQNNNYNRLIKEIDNSGLREKIKHIGYIDHEDLPYIYKMSQMLVMPTLFESVSIPIYESFSLKVPVCCSDVVALPEQVGEAGLIFDAHDTNDMARKIIMYLKNESLRTEKAEKGFERVAGFNHEEYLRKVLTVTGL